MFVFSVTMTEKKRQRKLPFSEAAGDPAPTRPALHPAPSQRTGPRSAWGTMQGLRVRTPSTGDPGKPRVLAPTHSYHRGALSRLLPPGPCFLERPRTSAAQGAPPPGRGRTPSTWVQAAQEHRCLQLCPRDHRTEPAGAQQAPFTIQVKHNHITSRPSALQDPCPSLQAPPPGRSPSKLPTPGWAGTLPKVLGSGSVTWCWQGTPKLLAGEGEGAGEQQMRANEGPLGAACGDQEGPREPGVLLPTGIPWAPTYTAPGSCPSAARLRQTDGRSLTLFRRVLPRGQVD